MTWNASDVPDTIAAGAGRSGQTRPRRATAGAAPPRPWMLGASGEPELTLDVDADGRVVRISREGAGQLAAIEIAPGLAFPDALPALRAPALAEALLPDAPPGERSQCNGWLADLPVRIGVRAHASGWSVAFWPLDRLNQEAASALALLLCSPSAIGLSHALRAPLSRLLAAAQTLDGESLAPEARKLVDTVLDAGEQLRSQLARLLDLQTLSADDHCQPTIIDAGQTLREAHDRWSEAATAAGSRVLLSLGPLPQRLSTDLRLLTSGLDAMLDQSLRAGGQQPVRLSGIHHLDARGRGWLTVAVRDHGPSLAEPPMDPRPLRSLTLGGDATADPSLGLDLSLVAERARRLGGQMRLRAARGGGTVALLRLPATLEKPASDAAPDSGAIGPD